VDVVLLAFLSRMTGHAFPETTGPDPLRSETVGFQGTFHYNGRV